MSATNRGGKRSPADFYATPAIATQQILVRLDLPGGRWLEPGAGNIIAAVNAMRRDVRWTAVEIDERHVENLAAAEMTIVADFLTYSFNCTPFTVALMNPPFRLALEFVQRCLRICEWVVCLERLDFLGTQKRGAWMRQHMPDVYILPNRPSFTGGPTDSNEYAWLVWPAGRHDRLVGQVEVLPVMP
jgi:hypothetical protein